MRQITGRSRCHRPGIPWVVGLVAVASLVASSAMGQVRIDQVQRNKYVAEGTITFYVDVSDANNVAVKAADIDPNGIKLLVDDKPVVGTYSVRPFADITESVSVAIILAAHNDYQPIKDEGEETYGNEIPFDMGVQGMFQFVQNLGGDNRVALWCYGEFPGFRELSGFKNAGPATADEFKRLAMGSCRREQRRSAPGEAEPPAAGSTAPNLYGLFREHVESGNLGKQLAEEPGRRIILMMSDGLDIDSRAAGGDQKIGDAITAITNEANNIGARIYAIGFDLLNGEYFRFLSRLANETGGAWVGLDSEQVYSAADIETQWRNMADRILNQLVVTYKPEGLQGGRKVRFGIEVTAGGATFRGPSTAPLMLEERGTDWLGILKWVGIGLGGVFLVVLLFILILRRIQNPRPKEVVVHQEVVSEPGGPARGKLLITKGPRAGETFFLTEEVTTIGRMDGNHIIIDDPSVSKRHAGIRVKDLRFELADLGAANGVMVNGRQITKQFLRDGDQIRIGDTEMTFHIK